MTTYHIHTEDDIKRWSAHLTPVGNTHDPNDRNARMYVARRSNETEQEAWDNYKRWLGSVVLGPVNATEWYTADELADMGLVGVYIWR